MRGEITLKILKCVKSASSETVDAAAAFLAAGYGASAKKLDYELLKRRKARTEQEERQKFYKLLYKLEKDGLIEKTKRKKPIILHLTLKGKKFLQSLSEKKAAALPDISYKTSNADKLIIVVFDIPESEKRKREWLRSALKNMKFRFIQKSVWIGKVKIPEEFLLDLKKLNLIDFVEIFEISKTGSLTKLV